LFDATAGKTTLFKKRFQFIYVIRVDFNRGNAIILLRMGFFEFCLEAMKSQLIQTELDMGFVGTHYDEQPNVVNASKIK